MINKIKNRAYQLLRSTQKYTGTDNVYLAQSGFWLILGQITAAATSFLLALAFANLLPKATYGNYQYIISLVGILGIFSLTGMRIAISQATARGLEGSFYTGFKTQLKWGLLASVVAIGGALYYWLRGNTLLPIPLLFIAAFLPLMLASRVYVGLLAGRKLFSVQTKYGIANQIITVSIMVIVLFLTKNILWLVTAYLVSHTFLNYFLYLLTKHKFQPNKKEDPQTISYGVHISLMAVISKVASYLDKILLFTVIGSSQLAVYSFAVIVPGEIQKILGHVLTLASPKLAPKSRAEIKKTIMKKVGKLFFLTMALAVLYVIVAPYLYKIFFPQYLESIHYSRLFVLSFISVPIGLLGVSFQAKMMKKELYLIKIAPFIKILLLIILVPLYGISGAIMAIIGAEIIQSGLILFLFRKF
ncbi:MAG: oligosaccharide flippase family protein [Candidatus Nealsonbacteria bacterium]